MTDANMLPGIIDALWAAINALKVSGVPQERISQVCQDFMNNAQPAETCAASSIEDENMAALFAKVDFKLHDPDYLYKLEQNDTHGQTGHTQLSQWAGQ